MSLVATVTPWYSYEIAYLPAYFLGGIGAIYGLVVWLIVRRNLAHKWITYMNIAIGIYGGVCLTFGLIALKIGQPYSVWYPLLLPGSVGVLLSMSVGYGVKQYRQKIELQRMDAQDLG